MPQFVHPFYQTPFPQATAQVTYATTFDNPWPGTPGNGAVVRDFATGINATVSIPFGVLVSRDVTNGDQAVKLPAAAGDVQAAVGIAVRTGAMESRRDLLPPSYAPGESINIETIGDIWAAPETAVVKGGAVFVRITANGPFTQRGAFRADNDGGNAVQLAGAMWDSSQTVPSQPAKIALNRIGQLA
jgi:hypothetical protein